MLTVEGRCRRTRAILLGDCRLNSAIHHGQSHYGTNNAASTSICRFRRPVCPLRCPMRLYDPSPLVCDAHQLGRFDDASSKEANHGYERRWESSMGGTFREGKNRSCNPADDELWHHCARCYHDGQLADTSLTVRMLLNECYRAVYSLSSLPTCSPRTAKRRNSIEPLTESKTIPAALPC